MSVRRGAPAGFAAAFAVLLAACQAAPPPGERESRPATANTIANTTIEHPVPRAAPAPVVDRGAELPEPPPDIESVLRRRLAALGQQPVDRPADLVGRTAAQIESLLGNPDFARREDPAEIWQYSSDGCVLNLFLYARDDGRRVVNHAELRARSPSVPVATEPCLRDLVYGRVGAAG